MRALSFGKNICYRSPIDGHLTKCVYIRNEGQKAVIMFRHAERVARVNYEDLVLL